MPLIRPNTAQQILDTYAERFECAINAGMFKPRGGCPGDQSADAPWLQKPPQYREFNHINSITVQTIVAGDDTVVLEWVTPLGFDGVIGTIVNQFNGQGFIEGSGSIQWRIRVNNTWVTNYEDIRSTLGVTDSPYIFGRGGIRFREKSRIRMYVRMADPTLFALTDRVICGLTGWYYHMEPYSRVYA